MRGLNFFILANAIIAIVVIIGWVANIWQLANMMDGGSTITLLLLVKLAGVFFFPMGAFFGWWGFF